MSATSPMKAMYNQGEYSPMKAMYNQDEYSPMKVMRMEGAQPGLYITGTSGPAP